MTESPVVLLEERPAGAGRVLAIATLNSERSLNSLSLDMIALLQPALARWAADPRVVAVFLQGAGEKAFCAGGDIRRIYTGVRENGYDDPYALDFFSHEYRLDYSIHRFPKPLIVWGGGIVMGGGIGLLAGASHRIATEGSRLAMPEIGIGLYPDVGGSWFLARLPGRLGLFLGLTGCHLNAADALYTGFASHLAAASRRHDLLAALAALPWSADPGEHSAQISALLAAEPAPALPQAALEPRLEAIAARTEGADLAAVHAALTAPSDDVWLAKAGQNLAKGSPTSAGLIWRQWHEGARQSLPEVFRQELTVSVQCARHPDFHEGVRALLIDKDNSPHWQPATLAGLTPAWIDEHYQEPWNGPHPLADLA